MWDFRYFIMPKARKRSTPIQVVKKKKRARGNKTETQTKYIKTVVPKLQKSGEQNIGEQRGTSQTEITERETSR
jgi:hypothetical protein